MLQWVERAGMVVMKARQPHRNSEDLLIEGCLHQLLQALSSSTRLGEQRGQLYAKAFAALVCLEHNGEKPDQEPEGDGVRDDY